ncbi:hypothetical protein QC761_503460 [Podospora bellae-mahoneyi]|uniref:Cytochrome P450 n=1 Tax=Podospora bellae-mahoneyi TaxID=2093777 RepID=A0ABR0FCP0_9PEZI|nr:hypothetical protein QC761_503460 [Podospora bellae-mahoneyi]
MLLDQSHLNGSSLVVVTSAGLAFYGLALTIYRIWFHLLAGFPGPKLAAATGWYQTYYEVMTYGKLSFKLAELHTRYGPIVQFSPWELSIRDPGFYQNSHVHGSVRRTEVSLQQRTALGFDGSHMFIESHELHRLRQKPLEPFFSRRAVEFKEDLIVQKAQFIVARIGEWIGNSTPLQLELAYFAYVTDVVGEILFGGENPSLLEHSEFAPD